MKEDSIIQKLKSIMRLLDDPATTPGEKNACKVMAEKLMNKHNINIDDLNDVKREVKKFSYTTKYERKLIAQIAYKILGSLKGLHIYWYGKNVHIRVSKIEEIDIRWLYQIYRKSFRKKMDEYFEAFIQANKIFAITNNNDKEYSQEELQRLYRIMQIADGIEPDQIIPASRHLNAYQEVEHGS